MEDKERNPVLEALRHRLRAVEKEIEKTTAAPGTDRRKKDLVVLRSQRKHLMALIDVEERQIPLFESGAA